jgi:hypothetical protein
MSNFQRFFAIPVITISVFTSMEAIINNFWHNSPPTWFAMLSIAVIGYALLGAFAKLSKNNPRPYFSYRLDEAVCDVAYLAAMAWNALIITHWHLFARL